MNLTGNTILITGGGSGIGRRLAEELHKLGNQVIIAGRRRQALDETTVANPGMKSLQFDIEDPAAIRAFAARVAAEFPALNVLFNNAGISPADDDSILTTGLDAWKRVQDVNLTSVYLCCKYGIPHLQKRGGGSIINTASFVAVLGSATSQISYTASKGGVLAMSRELAVQFARENIRVNALCPGPVNTPLLIELFAKDPERAARRLVHVPMGRFGEPEEIANAVLFLASDDASFVTATTFMVDGGIHGAYVTPL